MTKLKIALTAFFIIFSSSVFAMPLLPMSDFAGSADWKVGDHLGYQVMMGAMGQIGTIEKDVYQDAGTAVWLRQTTLLNGTSDIQEMLVDRASGNVLQFVENGKAATYTENPLTVDSQDEESVTVVAGTFQCVHALGKDSKGTPFENWSNLQEIPIDGNVKTVLDTTTSIELVEFHRGT